VPAERIVEGVWRILKGYVNAYLFEASDGVVMVDSGTPKKAERLLQAVRDTRHDERDLRAVLITHHHVDHVGSLAELARRTGATVYVPAGDAPIIRGQRPAPPPNRAVPTGRILGPVLARFIPKLDVPRVDVELHEGDDLPLPGGMRVIDTPGHTAGHISYLLPSGGGVLFAGDAAGARGSKVAPPVDMVFGTFTEDLDAARRSFAKLARFEFDVMLPGHGKLVRERAAELFRRSGPAAR